MLVLNAMDLKSGKKADYSRTGTLMQPLQFLPEEEKDEEWHSHMMDWIEWQGIKQLGLNARRIMKNYKLAKGVIDRSDYIAEENPNYADLLNTLESDTTSALELKFYPLVPTILDTLCNEFAKRNTEVTYFSVDDQSYNELLQQKQEQIAQVLISDAQQKIIDQLLAQGMDPDDPMIQQEAAPEKMRSLPEIQTYYEKSYVSMIEQWAQHQHEIDAERFKMDELEERGFRDSLISDREFWHYKMGEDDYNVDLWNPALTFYIKAPGTRYISDGSVVGMMELMTVPDVIDTHGWLMTADQLETLEQVYPVKSAGYAVSGMQNDGSFYDATKSHDWNVNRPSLEWRQFMSVWQNEYNGGDIVNWILKQSENTYDFNSASYLRVTTMYFKSQRKLGYVTRIADNGEITVNIVGEKYKITDKPIYNTTLIRNKSADNLLFGEHIEWLWINEVRGGIKIGPNRPTFLGMANPGGVNPMYLGVDQNKPGRLKFQFRGEKSLYGAKLPVEGAVFSDRNTKSISFVDRCKPFQISYNIVNNQIGDILIDEIGTVVMLDQNTLPKKSLGQDWGKNAYANAFVAMKDFQILPLDTSLTNTESPNAFGHFQTLNLEQTNRLMSRVQLATFFKQQLFEVIGISPQRLGQQMGQIETAKGIEQAITGSYAQTEQYFIQHSDYLMPRVHQMRTDLAMYYQSKNPSNRLRYMTSADERINFEINGVDFLTREINVYATTKIRHRSLIENLKNLALQNNTSGSSIFDLGSIMKSNSMAEVDHALKAAENKLMQEKQGQQEHAEKLQQMSIDAAEKEKALEREHDLRKEEMKNRKDLLVAEIRAAGYGAMQDINANAQSDFVDYMDRMERDQNFQETMNLQREKETARSIENRDKMSMEREKLQAQKEMKNIDYQIARENQTKAELKAKGKKIEDKKKPKKK